MTVVALQHDNSGDSRTLASRIISNAELGTREENAGTVDPGRELVTRLARNGGYCKVDGKLVPIYLRRCALRADPSESRRCAVARRPPMNT